MADDRLEFRPQDHLDGTEGPQTTFLATAADIAIMGGSAGGGKTFALLMEAVRHIHIKNFSAVFFRRTSPQITYPGGLWDESHEIYPHLGGTPLAFPGRRWEFPGGGRVAFSHMQHEADKLSWKGAQVPLLIFDQLEEFTESQFFYLMSRNRSTCGVRPYVRASCNPDADSWLATFLQWWWDPDTGYAIEERSGVMRWFIRVGDEITWGDSPEELAERHPDIPPKSVVFVRARLEDNPILMQKDPQYYANLMALPLVERERLYGGNWKIRALAGKIFNSAWWKYLDATPSQAERVRYWDKAGTEEGVGARTAGVLLARDSDRGRWIIEDVKKGRWSALERETVIRETAIEDGPDVTVWVEQEPGSGGKESAENTVRMIGNLRKDGRAFTCRMDRVTGDKIERAMPLSAQVEAGNVYLYRAPWNAEFVGEAHAFEPNSRLKDQVDAAAGAFNKLGSMKKPVQVTAPDLTGLTRVSPWRNPS